ncbi:MAG: DUF3576 domain-containing protein [Alphaproteobacteria bacterium]|nr:DUF3576 domain-containing protein [Alphaproteobacteria bacterium]
MTFFRFFILALLCGCSNTATNETSTPIDHEDKRKLGFGSLGGADFLVFGGSKKAAPTAGYGSMVNPYLWRSSIETLSFMPLLSADATGGILITDWYAPAENKNEQIKVTVHITDQALRADAVKVTVHKQLKDKSGQWLNASPDPKTGTELEDIILTKARQLRIHALK